jgi:hypothetical protein
MLGEVSGRKSCTYTDNILGISFIKPSSLGTAACNSPVCFRPCYIIGLHVSRKQRRTAVDWRCRRRQTNLLGNIPPVTNEERVATITSLLGRSNLRHLEGADLEPAALASTCSHHWRAT